MERNIEGVKKALIYPPALYDNYSTESAAVDGNDFDEAEFTLYVGDTDIDVDFKVQESDASGSGFADITDAAITELGDSDDNKFVVINVNLVPGSRKRYLRGVLAVGDGTQGAYACGVCELRKAGAKPTTSGAAEVVKV